MSVATVTRFRERCFEYFEQAIEHKEPVFVTMDSGNAVVLSEERYHLLCGRSRKRELGTLAGKMSVAFANDFKMSDKELIGV